MGKPTEGSESLVGEMREEISKNQKVFPNLGKLQFHRKVEKTIQSKKDKTFSQRIDNQTKIICFMKLKQFVKKN